MNIELPRYSQFTKTPVYTVDNNLVFGLTVKTVYPDPTDTVIEVALGVENRLDKISFLQYGTERFWWALAQVNSIIDPLEDVPVGTILRIPSINRLNTN